jgi:hypothetical protein
LNINEKCFRKKSPEAIALQATTSHYFLFTDKDVETVKVRAGWGIAIDTELELMAEEIITKEKVSGYVR